MKNWKRLQSESLFQRTAESNKITIWVPICHHMGSILGQVQASWALLALLWHTKRGIEKRSLPKGHECKKLEGVRTDGSRSPRGGQKEGKEDNIHPTRLVDPRGVGGFRSVELIHF